MSGPSQFANPKLNSEDTKTRFTDYVVLVTGGCSGIGKATLERFANDGATVYALDIRIQKEDELKEKFGDRVSCIELDVSDAERCKEVVNKIAANHNSKIHTLVNCAAYFGSKGLEAAKSDWIKSFEVNVIGYSNMVQAVVPFMPKDGGCSVVNIGSISGKRAQPTRWTYSATKGAVHAVTKCMALDLHLNNIRVNSIAPGWIWSPEVLKACDGDREVGHAQWHKFFMTSRLGEVEEVAAVITFLASKDASYITGANIPVCGGYLAVGPEQMGESSKYAGTEESAE